MGSFAEIDLSLSQSFSPCCRVQACSRLMTSQVLRVDRSPWDKRRASSGPCGSATSDESLSVRDKGDHDELSPISVLWLENLLSVREIGETEPSAVLPRRFRSCAV